MDARTAFRRGTYEFEGDCWRTVVHVRRDVPVGEIEGPLRRVGKELDERGKSDAPMLQPTTRRRFP